ncbi:MAG TPA: MFS transporter [Bacillota bacterium]|nr:MFS transporter [Bacillota bacterium]
MEREVKRPQLFGLDRNIFFTGLTSFLTDTSTKMIYCIMPLFLLSIGASKTMLSLIEGIAESTASLLKALSGFWSDKIGKNKPFMVIGYVVTAVITPVYAWVVNPFQVLYLRFIERVGKGIRTAPRDSLVAGSAEQGAVGKSFGFHKAMDNAGAITGPLLAYMLLHLLHLDYRQVFFWAGIPAILGVLCIIFFVNEIKKARESLPAKIRLKDFPKRYYIFLAVTFLFTLGNSTDALLLVKARDVGIQVALIPLVYLVFNSVSVLFAIPLGALSDRIGRGHLIVMVYLLYSIFYLGFVLAGDPIMIMVLFALYGLYSAAIDGIQKAFVSDFLDSNKKCSGLGIYNSL